MTMQGSAPLAWVQEGLAKASRHGNQNFLQRGKGN